MIAQVLVRHCVDDKIHAQTNAERRIFFRVSRIIGELPGIAKVVIEGHHNHDAPAFIANAAPHWLIAIAAVRFTGALHGTEVRHLILFSNIEHGVENGVVFWKILYIAVGENLLQADLKAGPFGIAKVAIAEHETTALQIFANLRGLGIAQLPGCGHADVKIGPIENIVAFVGIDGLLHRAHINAREPPDRPGKSAISTRVVHRPIGAANKPIAATTAPATAPSRWIHEAAENKFGLVFIIWRQIGSTIAPFHGDKFAKRLLREQQRKTGQKDHAANFNWQSHQRALVDNRPFYDPTNVKICQETSARMDRAPQAEYASYMSRLTFTLALCCMLPLFSQPPRGGFGGPGGGPGGPGGPGGMGQRRELLPQFDKDGDGYLNTVERKAAREYLAAQPRRGRGGGMFGGGSSIVGKPGPKLKPSDVKSYGSEKLYDPHVLRTIFIEFEDADWEKEMADFYHTDVDVPARITVDGKVYNGVGVHFRGASSYMAVPEGGKRSLDLSMNMINPEQRLGGYRSLNLLNSNGDPTFMRTALSHYVASQYIAAPKVNWMRVVINGESWGVYVNTQQINSELTAEWFGSAKGARWKVNGSPRGRGGLAYLGEDPAPYKSIYTIKSKDNEKSWAQLINLCKVLNQTAPDKLEKALAPILDVDGALKFLALDKAVINNDGFWTRASDYSIYADPSGKFHVIPWDANETFREMEQMGRRGGGESRGDGIDLDPFQGAADQDKALLYRLLAVPALRERYLGFMRDITEKWLDWKKIGPLVADFQSVIAADVQADTRKIFSNAAFTKAVTEDGVEPGSGPTAPPNLSLKSFVEKRRAYLLNYPGIKR